MWFRKKELANPGMICNAEMERVANLLVIDVGKQGVSLDYSGESLRAIDRLLAGYGSDRGNGDKNMGLVDLVGAYFGEVVRRHYGGEWFENIPPDNATGLWIDRRSDMWLWCHAVVYKQLENGRKSLHAIFEDIPKRMAEFGARSNRPMN